MKLAKNTMLLEEKESLNYVLNLNKIFISEWNII